MIPLASQSFSEHVFFSSDNAKDATTNSILAAILFELYQIPFDPSQAYLEVRRVDVGSGEVTKTTYEWRFIATAPSGEATSDLVRAFNDAKWISANPTHQIAVIKRIFEAYFRLIDKVKSSVPLAVIEKNGRQALIPWNASVAARHQLIQKLDE